MFFSRSKAVSLAITQREDGEGGVKARFHKAEGIFSHRCHRHRHASRCFLGFSSFFKSQSCWLIAFSFLLIKKNLLITFRLSVALRFNITLEKRLTKRGEIISNASRRHLGGISKAGKRRESKKKNYNLTPTLSEGEGEPTCLRFLLKE